MVRASFQLLFLASLVVWLAPSATAAMIIAAFDSRSETDSNGPGPTHANISDLAVGPISAGRSFRTYLTFDLSSEEPASDVSLQLFNIGSEGNTSALPQVFSLFTTTPWDDVAAFPGPEGVEVATFSITPVIGNDAQDISFNSPALTAAYNAVQSVGGLLHLGIKSSQENAAARSFVFLGSMEDLGMEPVLLTVAVPEPASLALVFIGMVFVAVCHRN